MLVATVDFPTPPLGLATTTTGMGTDQGKTSNINGLAIASDAVKRPAPAVGLTTFRPPYTPTTYGVFAGRDIGELADPARHTPMHSWHVSHNALFEDVGQWKRASGIPARAARTPG